MKVLVKLLVLIVCLFAPIRSTIWDNIFSQTQASHPINLTQSFNIDFQLPKQYDLDGNFDFNSQMKTLTVKLSKDILIQKLDVIKAQIDLEELILNVDQLLLGCEKFMIGIQDEASYTIKERVNNVGVSKKSLFMINLLFKYIGRYELTSQKEKPNKKDKKQQGDILGIFKDNPIFDQLNQALGLDSNSKKNSQSLISVQYYDMFQFSIVDVMQKNPQVLIQKLDKEKKQIQDKFEVDNERLNEINLQAIDWSMLKFILLTNPKTGEITKVYRNKEMKQEMEFRLQSNEKTKLKCNKQAKKLTFQNLTDGAKYLYDNKDTIGNMLN